MRINLNDLKRAVEYIEAETDVLSVGLRPDGVRLCISAVDRQGQGIEIQLFEATSEAGQPLQLPKVVRKENL